MPGLVSIIDTRGNSDIEKLLSKMIFSIKSQNWYLIDKYINDTRTFAIGRADLGILNAQKQPIFNEDKTLAIFMYGEIYDYTTEKDKLITKGHNFKINNDPEFLVHFYEEYGLNSFEKLNGSFVAIIYDNIHQRVVIVNDRYGQRPLYYTIKENRMLISSEVKAILRDPSFHREVNYEAVAELLTFRHLLDNKTLLQNVHLLAPASVLVYSIRNQTLRLFKYWSLESQISAKSCSEEESLEEINECFKQAVNRMMSKEMTVGISLSGGLDARTIMSAVDSKAYPIKSISSGIKECSDKKLTRQISYVSSCDHVFNGYEPDFLSKNFDCIKKVVALTDGMRGSSYNVLTLNLAKIYQNQGIKIVLTGHGGEIAKLDRAYHLSFDKNIMAFKNETDLQNRLYKKMSVHSWINIDKTKLFTRNFSKIMIERPITTLKSVLNQIDTILPVEDKITYLFIHEFFRKFAVLSLLVNRNYVEIRLPFFDNDFLDCVMRAPLTLRTNYRIHRYIIKKNNPALLKIPVSDTRVRLDANKFETLFIAIPYKIFRRLGYFSYDIPEDYVRKNVGKDIFDRILLDEKTLGRGYYNPKYLKELVHKYASGETDLFEILNLMLTFEIWLRIFID